MVEIYNNHFDHHHRSSIVDGYNCVMHSSVYSAYSAYSVGVNGDTSVTSRYNYNCTESYSHTHRALKEKDTMLY